jgi:DNA-binding NarL/FixJ family response regulator
MRKQIQILHVEDSTAMIALVKQMMINIENIQTIEAAYTDFQAKEILGKQTIDVAILDIHLKEGNGISLLKWIRQNHPSIVVIMFSNHSDSLFRSAVAKAGADYFFDKSTEFEQIPKIINKLCN